MVSWNLLDETTGREIIVIKKVTAKRINSFLFFFYFHTCTVHFYYLQFNHQTHNVHLLYELYCYINNFTTHNQRSKNLSIFYIYIYLGRPRRRWEDNIKMDLQEVGRGCGDWMELTQDRDGWRALVSTVMNLRVP